MFLKKIDFLSPNITLYHRDFLSHSSKVSGFISLISFIIIILFGVYYSLDLIRRENPKIFFYNSFVEKTNSFQINSSNLFHFITLGSMNSSLDMDLLDFRIIGLETFYSYYISSKKNLSKFDHWLYGKCNIEADGKSLEDLINKDEFEKGVCLKKYYSSLDNKYYDKDDPNFRWPKIGFNSRDSMDIYCILMESCKEDTLKVLLGEGYHCNDKSKYENLLLSGYGIRFNFIDHLVHVLDYKDPYNKYFYSIQNTLDGINYSINHINLNPSSVKTNDGFIFNHIYEEISYIFDRNDVFVENMEKDNEIYMIYTLYMKNRMQYYKRIYKTFQEVISEIGGISEFITLVAGFINSLYNEYNILYDFGELLSTHINRKYNNNNINIVTDTATIGNNYKQLETSNSNKSLPTDIYKNIDSNNEINEKNPTSPQSTNINNKSFIKENKEDPKIDNKMNIDMEIKVDEKFSFWKFIFHKSPCGKKNDYFRFYEKLRKKIISEENFLKNFLDVHNLIIMSKINGLELENHCKSKDLINI